MSRNFNATARWGRLVLPLTFFLKIDGGVHEILDPPFPPPTRVSRARSRAAGAVVGSACFRSIREAMVGKPWPLPRLSAVNLAAEKQQTQKGPHPTLEPVLRGTGNSTPIQLFKATKKRCCGLKVSSLSKAFWGWVLQGSWRLPTTTCYLLLYFTQVDCCAARSARYSLLPPPAAP